MGLISEQNISDASSKNEMQNHHVKHMSKIHLIAYKIDFLIRLHCNEDCRGHTGAPPIRYYATVTVTVQGLQYRATVRNCTDIAR